ncbi:L-ascorbate metabolism protein UlaG, beta-lactamase superfamily [Blastococcus aggregatus]|uniref:L-ascorbate metabolism protein UlaG, beta-lactamase superfamily n=1 Tax=Blastococcus aggregatus TaxID=38502 RepID=A0A285V4Q7_9ACTN|nr:MBL fold metallo-hydrolase [Blastococcus aggregatus]SOC47986.1 L-ascorbate metabolism protein UlaG, beta-lactamase superfamily [Blastococcus aggregatus]
MPSLRRRAAVTATVLAGPVGWLTAAAWGLPTALGAHRRRLRPVVAGSPHFSDGTFSNTLPTPALAPANTRDGLLRQWHEERHVGLPGGPIPLARPEFTAEAAELAVTWFGHASALLEVDGRRVLVDPVWGYRVSPSPVFGPTRLHEPPMPIEDLPPVDAVLISHDHYDHLDLPTVRALLATQTAPFVVPLGIGEHLRKWRVPEERIVELDWDGVHEVAGLTLTCTEARHFSGRYLHRNTTLWASWAIAGPAHRVYFGGDTGYTPAFAAIGARLGPFDLTLLPIGAYNDAWHAIHMDPEEAVRAHGDLGGAVLLPIHWATFNLAFHRWAEPVQRLLAAARPRDVAVVVPRPGERIDVLTPPALDDWWTAVGSAADTPEDEGSAGVGSSVLARTLTRLTALLPG